MTDRQTQNSIDDRASDDHAADQVTDDRATDAATHGWLARDNQTADTRALRLLTAPSDTAGRPDTASERPLAFAYLEIRHEDSCLKLRGLRCNCVPELVARWKPAAQPA